MPDLLTVVAKLRAKPGRETELEALLKRQVKAVRSNEPDCLVYRLHRLTQDATVFLFYEQYRSEAAFDAHRKAAHLAAFQSERKDLVAGPAEVEIYRGLTD
ncbi:MAG: putative quinol monooxygenase [Candidatus Rokuibacteriota bacterium]